MTSVCVCVCVCVCVGGGGETTSGETSLGQNNEEMVRRRNVPDSPPLVELVRPLGLCILQMI